MPHYFFDIKDGHRLIDPAGVECRDDDDAILKARMIASAIAEETHEGARKIAVLSEDKCEIAAVPVHPGPLPE